jgi:hypothetical protein
MSAPVGGTRPSLDRMQRQWSDLMDILYCTGWLYALNRRKALLAAEPDQLPSTSASSTVKRLLLALVAVAAIAGALSHGAGNTDLQIASTTQPSQLGEAK